MKEHMLYDSADTEMFRKDKHIQTESDQWLQGMWVGMGATVTGQEVSFRVMKMF